MVLMVHSRHRHRGEAELSTGLKDRERREHLPTLGELLNTLGDDSPGFALVDVEAAGVGGIEVGQAETLWRVEFESA